MSSFDREAARVRLGAELFDVLVIGGGITGAGVALDAATRGLRTAIVERDDWASGTSSKSSKLVHGGLRYLQQKEYRLVYENLAERQALLRNAPHLVSELPFLIPLFGRDGVVNAAVSKAYTTALWLYDLTGGLRIGKPHRRITRDEALRHLPTLRADCVAAAFVYYDARTDDARLTLALVRTAVLDHGAVAANHLGVARLTKDGSGHVDGATLTDGTTVRARSVVNAAGVWADDVRALDEALHPHSIRPAKGIHVTVRADRLPCDIAAVLPVPKDHRSVFVVPWGDRTYVGTTDTDYDGPLDDPSCTPADVAYLLDAVNVATTSNLTAADVIGSWAGLRPLVKGAASERTADLSRRHRVTSSPSGVVTVTGGKLTTYRKMAADTVDALGSGRRSRTRRLPLRGAVGLDQVRSPGAPQRLGIAPDVCAHLVSRYGAEAPRCGRARRRRPLSARAPRPRAVLPPRGGGVGRPRRDGVLAGGHPGPPHPRPAPRPGRHRVRGAGRCRARSPHARVDPDRHRSRSRAVRLPGRTRAVVGRGLTTPTPPIPFGSPPVPRWPGVEVPAAILTRLGAVCPGDTGADTLAEAGRDWWPLALGWAIGGRVPAVPAVVVRPRSASEVAGVLRICNEARVPVTPAGGRSGVCGASIPAFGGVALDLTAMTGVLEADDKSLLVSVLPGTFGDVLEADLRERGVTLGHWPQSMSLSTVGGWLACRSAGQYSTRYGKIEDMAVGLDVVLADGTELRTGGRAPRSAVGPDLTQLFVGSEGTLGVITAATLRVHPVPAHERRDAWGFASFDDGLDACRRILRRGANPAVLRLYDEAESRRTFEVDTNALIVLDEGDPGLVDAVMAVVAAECAASEPLPEAMVDRWLEHRNDVSALPALVSRGVVLDTIEIAARWAALPLIYRDAVAALRADETVIAASAHQSHAYPDGACLYFTWAARLPEGAAIGGPESDAVYVRAWDAVTGVTLGHGGTLSHHHGIGINRGRYVADALGPGALGVLRSLKTALDPNGILNPGKFGLPSSWGGPPWP